MKTFSTSASVFNPDHKRLKHKLHKTTNKEKPVIPFSFFLEAALKESKK